MYHPTFKKLCGVYDFLDLVSLSTFQAFVPNTKAFILQKAVLGWNLPGHD